MQCSKHRKSSYKLHHTSELKVDLIISSLLALSSVKKKDMDVFLSNNFRDIDKASTECKLNGCHNIDTVGLHMVYTGDFVE